MVHADAAEISDARRTPLGTSTFRLVGTAEFGTVAGLLSEGQRAQFTRDVTANTTNALGAGRRVAVKALMIGSAPQPTLNLLSAQPLAESCQ